MNNTLTLTFTDPALMDALRRLAEALPGVEVTASGNPSSADTADATPHFRSEREMDEALGIGWPDNK